MLKGDSGNNTAGCVRDIGKGSERRQPVGWSSVAERGGTRWTRAVRGTGQGDDVGEADGITSGIQ